MATASAEKPPAASAARSSAFIGVLVTHVCEHTALTHVMQHRDAITGVKAHTPQTFGERLRWAREAKKLTQADLAKAVGLSPGAIGNYEAGDRDSSRKLAELSRALEVNALWLSSGTGPVRAFVADDNFDPDRPWETLVAQQVSHQPDTVPHKTWEELMSLVEGVESGHIELPKEFWVTLADDAMAPTAPAGTKVHFTRDQSPRYGDAVLLLGPDGALHVRQYGQSLTYGYQALPTNPLYAPFHGDMPGVRVVAVLTGIQAGWAQLSR